MSKSIVKLGLCSLAVVALVAPAQAQTNPNPSHWGVCQFVSSTFNNAPLNPGFCRTVTLDCGAANTAVLSIGLAPFVTTPVVTGAYYTFMPGARVRHFGNAFADASFGIFGICNLNHREDCTISPGRVDPCALDADSDTTPTCNHQHNAGQCLNLSWGTKYSAWCCTLIAPGTPHATGEVDRSSIQLDYVDTPADAFDPGMSAVGETDSAVMGRDR